MTARFDLVTIDTPQPEMLVTFWCAALALHESEREDGDRWIVLSDEGGTRRIGLQRGDHVDGGVHLDLWCAEECFEQEVHRLVGAGASLRRPARAEPYGAIANLADPDGNAFDLCAYRHNGPAPVGW